MTNRVPTHLVLHLQRVDLGKERHDLVEPLEVDLCRLELGKVVVISHQVGDDALLVAGADNVWEARELTWIDCQTTQGLRTFRL